MEMLLFFVLVSGRLLWKNDFSKHWKSIVLVLVPGNSHVIALRGGYSDGYS